MSLLGKIVALFGGTSARRVCVVDGDRLAGGDRVGPGERFQALSKLARFATREELSVRVVFGGRPLREAEDGANYNGVDVYYAESPAEVRERIIKVLSAAGKANAVLVTSDAALESDLTGKGYASMRVSTLRKAMEPIGHEGGHREGGNGGRDRNDRDGGRRNRGRNRDRGRRPHGDTPREGGSGQSPDSGGRSSDNQPQSGGGGNDSVKNLIDLVE